MQLNVDDVWDLLDAANIYLLSGLKKHCGNFLCNHISEDTVVEILRVARLHDLAKLEDTCAEFIADNINLVCYLK